MTEGEKVSLLFVVLSVIIVRTETSLIYSLVATSHFCLSEICDSKKCPLGEVSPGELFAKKYPPFK